MIHPRYRRFTYILLALLLGQFLLYPILFRNEKVLRALDQFFTRQQPTHINLFQDIHFSVGDLMYSGLTVLVICGIILLLTKQRRWQAAALLTFTLNVFLMKYQVFWGFRYQLNQAKTWDTKQKYPLALAKRVAITELDSCIKIGNRIAAEKPKIAGRDIKSTVEILQRADVIRHYPPAMQITAISMKPSLFGGLMNYSGIAGYYNPFTAEAQYNPNLPISELPFSLAHERAHQLGIAPEYQASFAGYIWGTHSTEDALRYSCHWYALKMVLYSIREHDAKLYQQLTAGFSTKMKQDRLAELRFNERYSGKVDELFATMNNLFLKGNGEDGSISYSYFLDELLLYYQKKEPHLAMRSQKHK